MRRYLSLLARMIAIAAPMVFGIMVGRWLSPFLPQFAAWVTTLGVWAPLVFVVAYVLVVILMLPAFLLIMAGGAVFGTMQGTMLAMSGAMLGGTIAFLIARHVARDAVAKRVAKHPTLSAIDRSVGDDGAKLVFLLRLSPAIPFVLTNYALGITRVKVSHYVIGTLGLFPVVATYAAFGHASGVGTQGGHSPLSPLVLGIGVCATVALGLMLARITQRAMHVPVDPITLPSATPAND